VRKKEDSDSTSLARAYTEKKMKSPGSMLANDVILHFSPSSRPGVCHPISDRMLTRELVILNHKDGSSAAMVVDGGRRLRRKQEMWENKKQKRRAQDGRRMETWIRMADSTLSLSSLASGSPSGAMLGARTSHSTYPDADKGAQVPLFSQRESAKW
jgi:hypothetical protein